MGREGAGRGNGRRIFGAGQRRTRAARALLLADVAAHRDDDFKVAAAWEEAVLLGEQRPDFQAREAAIRAVTSEEVVALARKELGAETLSWTMSGNPTVAARAAAASHLGRSRPVVLER